MHGRSVKARSARPPVTARIILTLHYLIMGLLGHSMVDGGVAAAVAPPMSRCESPFVYIRV